MAGSPVHRVHERRQAGLEKAPAPILGRAAHKLHRPRENRPINAISALFAIAIGIVHASLAPVLAVGDLRPNLILAFVVAVTALLGLGSGAVWAFIGGLTANLLTSDPLGSLPLGLLLAAAAVAGLVRLIERPPVAAVFLGGLSGSLVVDVTGLVVLALAGSASMALSPPSFVSVLVPSAVVNAMLALVVWYGLRAVLIRVGREPAGA